MAVHEHYENPRAAAKMQSRCSGPRQRYLYCVVVVGLEWSKDTVSYADGITANGRVSHAGR
jgi:hypothetical protein